MVPSSPRLAGRLISLVLLMFATSLAWSQTLPTLRTTFVPRDTGDPSPCFQTTCFSWAAYGSNTLAAQGYNGSSLYIYRRLSSGPWYRHATLRNRFLTAVVNDEILVGSGTGCSTDVLALSESRWVIKQRIPACGTYIVQDYNRILFVDTRSFRDWVIYMRRADGVYVEESRLNPQLLVPLHEAMSVAMHGWTIVVGQPVASNEIGRAHIFQRRGGEWSLAKTLVADPALFGGMFGWTVAVGEFDVAISAPVLSAGPNRQGKVFIYSGFGENWFVRQELTEPAGASTNKIFGTAMTLKGRRLIVSADAPQVSTTGPYTYLYERGVTDPDWKPRAQFAAKNGAQRPMPSIFLSGNTAMINVPATELDPPDHDGVIPAVVNLPALLDPEIAP
jgi:hypothetical protein